MKRAAKKNNYPDCAVRCVLNRIGDKWSFLIILTLAKRPYRFGELKREISDISQRMLTETLRSLQRDGLVNRTVYSTMPLSVGYSLTEMGASILEPMMGLVRWAKEKQPAIEAARIVFDNAQH
ncbi:MAG: helix-turn-helix domain-containing protein [Hyphomicrobium sp.]|jgi:DNA-binding HxlR family transcriptional regulator